MTLQVGHYSTTRSSFEAILGYNDLFCATHHTRHARNYRRRRRDLIRIPAEVQAVPWWCSATLLAATIVRALFASGSSRAERGIGQGMALHLLGPGNAALQCYRLHNMLRVSRPIEYQRLNSEIC